MPGMSSEPMDRFSADAADLVRAHPPRVHNTNKRVVLDLASPPDAVHGGRVGYTRWPAMPLPPLVEPLPPGLLHLAPGYFDYQPLRGAPDGAVAWHLNFADPDLFYAYGGSLLAQDELQVVEHPVLASLREALVARGGRPRTVGAGGPTPVLVTGAERRVDLRTEPDTAAGRPYGLYGNAFAAAGPDEVAAAVRVIAPPTVSNILAIAAPSGGSGAYRADEIRRVVQTAYSGFAAAVLESARLRDHAGRTEAPAVVIHTGHWGCGAFGGDRTLMAMLQLLAAHLAGIEVLAFHTGPAGGDAPVERARDLLGDLLAAGEGSTEAVLGAVAGMGFRWGVSNGT